MKVKVLCRNPDNYIRETKYDIHRVDRNFDPALHPFEVPREYTRALNAVKLERVFAKPFLGSLDGHKDVVSCMAKNPVRLRQVVSGAMDGEVIIWSVGSRTEICRNQAHSRAVRGVAFSPDGENYYSIGDDSTIRTWKSPSEEQRSDAEPLSTIVTRGVLASASHHAKDSLLATCGAVGISVWEMNGSTQPLQSFTWAEEHPSYHCVRFNPSEVNVVAAAGSDRSILFADLRQGKAMKRLVTRLKTNSFCWNPVEPFVFTSANEDYNLYSFDMRNLSRPINIHKDHISAVVDVDYAPTGQEFVSAGYDKTIRIYQVEKGHSRDVYHTKRMQRPTCVLYSLDNKYVLCGSDEMNIRIWKARANEQMGLLRGRQKASVMYNEKLKEKFAAHPQIKRISKHRHVPKHVYNARKEISEIRTSQKRKEANRRLHSKPGSVPIVSERSKPILHVQQ